MASLSDSEGRRVNNAVFNSQLELERPLQVKCKNKDLYVHIWNQISTCCKSFILPDIHHRYKEICLLSHWNLLNTYSLVYITIAHPNDVISLSNDINVDCVSFLCLYSVGDFKETLCRLPCSAPSIHHVRTTSFGSLLSWYKHNTVYLKILSAVASNSYTVAAHVPRYTTCSSSCLSLHRLNVQLGWLSNWPTPVAVSPEGRTPPVPRTQHHWTRSVHPVGSRYLCICRDTNILKRNMMWFHYEYWAIYIQGHSL